MNFVLWIIFGAIAGWLASVIVKANNGLGMDILLGIVGAVVGGFIMQIFGATGVTGFNVYSLVVAVIGAAVVVSLGRLLTR